MIYPSVRAVALTAAGALPALLLAIFFPGIWYLGLFWVLLIVMLTVIDGVSGVPGPQVAFDVMAPGSAQVGEEFAVKLTAHSERALPRKIEALLEHDGRLFPAHTGRATGIFGSDQDEQVIALTAIRRGQANISALWVRWSGPFGLAWKQRRMMLETSVAVVPDIRPARLQAIQLFRRDALHGDMVQKELGAGSEFQALAEFRSGMDKRAIDWKRSARYGSLLAKEFRTERNNNIVFAVDSGRLMSEPIAGLPKVDRAVSAALLSAFVALRLGDRVKLFGFDSAPRVETGLVSGIGSFGLVQKQAAQIEYSSAETNYTLALTQLSAKLDRRSLIIIFSDFVDPTSAELMVRNLTRIIERHLVIFVLMRDVELGGMVTAPPETGDDIARAVTAASLMRERRVVISRLQRLGIHIVEAAHDRIGSDLVDKYIELKRRDVL